VIGSHWTLDYTPSWAFYSSREFKNTLNHAASLSWGTSYEDWVLGFSQSYNRSDTPSIETAPKPNKKAIRRPSMPPTNLTPNIAGHGVEPKFQQHRNGGNPANQLGNLANSKAWSTMEWLNYEFWPRLSAGIGVGGGYTSRTAAGFNQRAISSPVNWRATDKISFQLSGGLEDQQYLSGGAGALVTPSMARASNTSH